MTWVGICSRPCQTWLACSRPQEQPFPIRERKGLARCARYQLGEALLWVLRVRLLAELGVPVSELSAQVTQKPAFQDLLRELATLQSRPGKPENG